MPAKKLVLGRLLGCDEQTKVENSVSLLGGSYLLRRIRLKNFMSHVETEFELADGVNVIVGPNNCGKSAIVSALSVLATNASGDYMVRHGCDECSVTVTTDDGHEITWRRIKGVSSYVLDGQEFYRVGRGDPPPEVLEVLKLHSGDPNLDAFDVHFGHQKRPIFLLDEPGSKPAQFFASSSDAGRLLAMQKRHKEKVSNAKNERKSLIEEQAALNRKAAVLDRTVALDEELVQLELTKAEYEALEHEIHVLDEGIRKLKVLQNQVDVNAKTAQVLSGLALPPVLEDTLGLERDTARLSRLERLTEKTRQEAITLGKLAAPPALEDAGALAAGLLKLRVLTARVGYNAALVSATRTIKKVPEMHDAEYLETRLPRLVRLQRQVSREAAIVRTVENLIQPPSFIDTAEVADSIDRLKKLQRLMAVLGRLVEVANGLQAPPELLPAEELSDSIRELALKLRTEQQLRTEVKKVEQALEKLREEIQRYLEANPICPLCGSRMQFESLVGGGCSHGA